MTAQYRQQGIWSVLGVLCIICIVFAAPRVASDSLCFTIPLTKDSTSIFWCSRSGEIRAALSGPVVMDNGILLFYSANGYVAYSRSGKLVDSQSVFNADKKVSAGSPQHLRLAYPVDGTTLLYFRHNAANKDSLELYEKKLYKKEMSRILPPFSAIYKDVEHSQLFNLARNGMTDDITPKTFLKPNLIGYALPADSGRTWWSMEKFYTCTSPVVAMNNRVFESFFPGILPDSHISVRLSAICPLATYTQNGQLYYCGVYSQQNITDDAEVYQTLYVCDCYGNVQYSRTILKQLLLNEVLEYNRQENLNYTIRQPVKQMFLPSVDEKGCVFFGCVNYDKRILEVHTLPVMQYAFKAIGSGNTTNALLDQQRTYSLRIQPIKCSASGSASAVETGIMIPGDNNTRRPAGIGDIANNGYYAAIEHTLNPEISRRLSVQSGSIPPAVLHFRDSLAAVPDARTPYAMALYKASGEKIRTMYYGIGDAVKGARVLNVVDTSHIFVRVDCKKFAEILEFSPDGNVLHRFIFNREDFLDRRDIIAVGNDGAIIEEDYEQATADIPVLFSWELHTVW